MKWPRIGHPKAAFLVCAFVVVMVDGFGVTQGSLLIFDALAAVVIYRLLTIY